MKRNASSNHNLPFLNPYFIPKNTKWLLPIIFVIAFTLFIAMDFIDTDKIAKFPSILVRIVQQLSLIITSTIGTNFIISLCIEKKNKNDAFQEFFKNDFINSEAFNEMVPKEKQLLISDKYRKEYRLKNNPVLFEMVEYIERKLYNNIDDFYYEKCEQRVHCYIDKETKILTKKVDRLLEIKSYSAPIEKENFKLLSVYTKRINGEIGCEIKHLYIQKIGDKKLEKVDVKEESYQLEKPIDETLKRKNGYDCLVTYHLRNNVQLSPKDIFSVRIIAEVKSAEEYTSVFRLQVPCKKFTLFFDAPPGYKVKPNAFGFIDRAQKAMNSDEASNVNIEFDGWVFQDDGVIITLEENGS